jgi:hypothetical protein
MSTPCFGYPRLPCQLLQSSPQPGFGEALDFEVDFKRVGAPVSLSFVQFWTLFGLFVFSGALNNWQSLGVFIFVLGAQIEGKPDEAALVYIRYCTRV